MSIDSKVTGEGLRSFAAWVAPERTLELTAAEACRTVSPSDPQAAAEAYPEIVKALETARDFVRIAHVIGGWGYAYENIDKALAKVGR